MNNRLCVVIYNYVRRQPGLGYTHVSSNIIVSHESKCGTGMITICHVGKGGSSNDTVYLLDKLSKFKS